MAIIGRNPSPRALLMLLAAEEQAALSEVFPTTRAVTSMAEVRQEEWDCLVTRGKRLDDVNAGLFVLAVGTAFLRRPSAALKYGNSQLGRAEVSVARELVLPDDLPNDVIRLSRMELLPIAQGWSANSVLVQIAGGSPDPPPEGAIKPFLATTEGYAIAGDFTRRGDQSVLWSLPDQVRDIAGWAKAAIRSWREVDPVRFPELTPWTEREAWMTPGETRAREALQQVDADRITALTAFDRSEADARSALDQAVAEASRNQRSLMTTRGEELVGAVKDTLSLLGFAVRDMDEVYPETDRREDLEVTTADDTEWLVLAEVRGYAGGAQIADLMRLQRFKTRRIQDGSQPPSVLWYVVSQFVGRDPSERPRLFASNPNELETFKEDGGTAIDTADLFRLRRDVEGGDVQATEARDALRTARGRFSWPPSTAGRTRPTG